jgi:hypothetical protein
MLARRSKAYCTRKSKRATAPCASLQAPRAIPQGRATGCHWELLQTGCWAHARPRPPSLLPPPPLLLAWQAFLRHSRRGSTLGCTLVGLRGTRWRRTLFCVAGARASAWRDARTLLCRFKVVRREHAFSERDLRPSKTDFYFKFPTTADVF